MVRTCDWTDWHFAALPRMMPIRDIASAIEACPSSGCIAWVSSSNVPFDGIRVRAHGRGKMVFLGAHKSARRCGHCKSLAPTYRKLAKRFRPVDSVVVAKMDGTANEHENITVEGFPSIFLFPAGKGAQPISYDEADRSLKVSLLAAGPCPRSLLAPAAGRTGVAQPLVWCLC